eukprot:scaffold41942_cov76-Phaeocystis_antarctica.AAC.7
MFPVFVGMGCPSRQQSRAHKARRARASHGMLTALRRHRVAVSASCTTSSSRSSSMAASSDCCRTGSGCEGWLSEHRRLFVLAEALSLAHPQRHAQLVNALVRSEEATAKLSCHRDKDIGCREKVGCIQDGRKLGRRDACELRGERLRGRVARHQLQHMRRAVGLGMRACAAVKAARAEVKPLCALR